MEIKLSDLSTTGVLAMNGITDVSGGDANQTTAPAMWAVDHLGLNYVLIAANSYKGLVVNNVDTTKVETCNWTCKSRPQETLRT